MPTADSKSRIQNSFRLFDFQLSLDSTIYQHNKDIRGCQPFWLPVRRARGLIGGMVCVFVCVFLWKGGGDRGWAQMKNVFRHPSCTGPVGLTLALQGWNTGSQVGAVARLLRRAAATRRTGQDAAGAQYFIVEA